MFKALSIVGIILFVLITVSGIIWSFVTSKKHYKTFKMDLIMTTAHAIGAGIAGVLGILFYVLHKTQGYTVEPLHIVEIVLGGIIFIPSLVLFIDTLILKHFNVDADEKYKKIVKYSNIISLFSFIIFAIVMFEGLAYYLSYPLPNSISIGGSNGILSLNQPGVKTGGLQIAFYALFILGGAVLVYIYCDHKFYKIYGKHGMLESTFLIAFPAGLVGARLWYCYVLEFDHFSTWDGSWGATVTNNPFQVWQGGLAIMGGAILGIVAGVLWVLFKKREIKIRQAIDIIVPAILIAQAVGRWGNFFNQEVYGSLDYTINFANSFWVPTFIKFNVMTIDYGGANGITPFIDLANGTYNLNQVSIRLPLFFVEFLTNLAGYYFIRYLFEQQYLFKGISFVANKASGNTLSERTKNTISNAFPKGGAAGLYITWYGLTRVILEPLRDSKDEYNESFYSAIGMVAGGLLLIGIFAVYQYVIEPEYPFWKTRLRPVTLPEAKVKSTAKVNLNDEAVEELKDIKENKKESKKSSLNDDFMD